MASLKELDRIIPSHFTLSNKRLLIIAHVKEESVYFYDSIDSNTTIIVLTQPECYLIKNIFLELMIDRGVTVIDLKEKESMNPNYKLSDNSRKIIVNLITSNKYDQIITHPKYQQSNDPQNRALYDLVFSLIKRLGTNNHYTYNKIGVYGKPSLPCTVKKGIFELYCRLDSGSCKTNKSCFTDKNNDEVDIKTLQRYMDISSNISGLRRNI